MYRTFTYKALLVLLLSVLILGCGFDLSISSSGNGYCTDPAPVNGQYDPLAPGYIVVFRDGTAVADEVNRLNNIYDLRVGALYQNTLLGFFVEMANITLEKLRCEPSILYIEYNGSVTTNS